MWPLEGLQTTDGREVVVVDPGLHNHNSGPDFFNAKVKIGGTMWVGNVEIHDKSSDWYLHGHEHDEHYNNVILHVVGVSDREVQTLAGDFVPQMCLTVPSSVHDNYAELLRTDAYPPCYRIIPELTRLTIHSWMAALQTERLEQKTIAIQQRVKDAEGSWEDAYFQTMARNYGFGINGDAFEEWARHISPYKLWVNIATTCFKLRLSLWDRQDSWNQIPSLFNTERMHSRKGTSLSSVMNTSIWHISSR